MKKYPKKKEKRKRKEKVVMDLQSENYNQLLNYFANVSFMEKKIIELENGEFTFRHGF